MLIAAVLVPAALLGLVVGSFINVVSHRVPRGESVVRPRSRCPRCRNEISPRDNVPVISWVMLRGKCRSCAEPIPIRYPATEMGTSLLFVLFTLRFGVVAPLPAYLLLAAVLVAVTATDLEHRLVPKKIVWTGFGAGAVLLAAAAVFDGEPKRLVTMAAGSTLAFGGLFVIHFISPRGMGFGDVRLAALLGLFLGWLGLAYVGLGLFSGFVTGGVAGIGALLAGRSRKSALPFAPFLALGTVIAILLGAPILDWYLSTA
ncbi:MAG TPA: prepilin peptidase [Acidimicrobiales bacterium]|nr:prepilin peptidase [Acidimicrobiales bacterium]